MTHVGADGVVELPAESPQRQALTDVMRPDRSPAARRYRERLLVEFHKDAPDRNLDFSDDTELKAAQEKLLEHARSIGGLAFMEPVEIGLACQGLGFCNQYAISRLMGVAGPTPPLFHGRESPFNCFTFVEQHTDPTSSPRSGDLVHYPDAAGFPHFSLVIDPDPERFLVESKFGMSPGLFRHDIRHVPFHYGDRAVLLRVRQDPAFAALARLLPPAGSR